MAAFPPVRRSAPLFLLLGCLALFASCAAPPSERPRALYRVVWTATRTSDKAPLGAGSVRVAVNGSATEKLRSGRPAENQPAFTQFTARLTRTRTPGLLQLVTRLDMREAARNKKGKLKVSRRNIGALLPIHAGETQLTSLPSDPVHVEVRLERD